MKRFNSRLILILILVFLVSFTGFAEESKEKGLIGYWSFDEGKGTIVKDLSGNENHGEIKNGVNWVKGKVGNALLFDGTSGYVEIPMTESLKSTKAITIEFWMYPTPPHYRGFGGMINNVNGAANKRLLVRESNKLLTGQIYGDTFLGPEVVDNAWNHIVYVYDGKEQAWYLNGKLANTAELSGELESGDFPLLIGWGYNTPEYYFYKGMIDEVKLYNRALSSDEVAANFKR